MKEFLKSVYDTAYGNGVGGMYSPLFDNDTDFIEIKKVLEKPNKEDNIFKLLESLHDKAFEAGWNTIVGSTGTHIIKDIGAEKEAELLENSLIEDVERELLKIKEH